MEFCEDENDDEKVNNETTHQQAEHVDDRPSTRYYEGCKIVMSRCPLLQGLVRSESVIYDVYRLLYVYICPQNLHFERFLIYGI